MKRLFIFCCLFLAVPTIKAADSPKTPGIEIATQLRGLLLSCFVDQAGPGSKFAVAVVSVGAQFSPSYTVALIYKYEDANKLGLLDSLVLSVSGDEQGKTLTLASPNGFQMRLKGISKDDFGPHDYSAVILADLRESGGSAINGTHKTSCAVNPHASDILSRMMR